MTVMNKYSLPYRARSPPTDKVTDGKWPSVCRSAHLCLLSWRNSARGIFTVKGTSVCTVRSGGEQKSPSHFPLALPAPLVSVISTPKADSISLPRGVLCGTDTEGPRTDTEGPFRAGLCSHPGKCPTVCLTLGHISVPFIMRLRATCSFPVTSSRRADAIQAGG